LTTCLRASASVAAAYRNSRKTLSLLHQRGPVSRQPLLVSEQLPHLAPSLLQAPCQVSEFAPIYEKTVDLIQDFHEKLHVHQITHILISSIFSFKASTLET
jgi:hypothetical protein